VIGRVMMVVRADRGDGGGVVVAVGLGEMIVGRRIVGRVAREVGLLR
jgi:hypothetical protein